MSVGFGGWKLGSNVSGENTCYSFNFHVLRLISRFVCFRVFSIAEMKKGFFPYLTNGLVGLRKSLNTLG